MTTCPTCGVEKPVRVQRGDLVVESAPPRVWWKGGEWPANIVGLQFAMLRHLCQHGVMSRIAMQTIGSGRQTSDQAARVHLHKLRAKLPPGVTISNVAGWGYKLLLEGHDL